jgi:hypothetical protein
VENGPKAIGRNKVTGLRGIFVRIQGATAGAQQGYITAGATRKTDEKASHMVTLLREIA